MGIVLVRNDLGVGDTGVDCSGRFVEGLLRVEHCMGMFYCSLPV